MHECKIIHVNFSLTGNGELDRTEGVHKGRQLQPEGFGNQNRIVVERAAAESPKDKDLWLVEGGYLKDAADPDPKTVQFFFRGGIIAVFSIGVPLIRSCTCDDIYRETLFFRQ